MAFAFHLTVTHVHMRYHHDTITAITFLCASVQIANDLDWEMLKHLLKLFEAKQYHILTIDDSNLRMEFIKLYIGTAFAVCTNFNLKMIQVQHLEEVVFLEFPVKRSWTQRVLLRVNFLQWMMHWADQMSKQSH